MAHRRKHLNSKPPQRMHRSLLLHTQPWCPALVRSSNPQEHLDQEGGGGGGDFVRGSQRRDTESEVAVAVKKVSRNNMSLSEKGNDVIVKG